MWGKKEEKKQRKIEETGKVLRAPSESPFILNLLYLSSF